jgi:hypothetical protein
VPVERLGEVSGLWFGMMIEGVVVVSFSGRVLHCVHNLRKDLSICTHYPNTAAARSIERSVQVTRKASRQPGLI